MADNRISIIIQAQDKASEPLRHVSDEVARTGKNSEQASKGVFKLGDHLGALAAISVTAGLATRSLVGFMSDTIDEANKLQSALLGLNSVATAFGEDATAAKRAAQDLAKDGLMTVADSATGLKNLLAAGFSLPQAITLMKRFKDSAAFGRQASLSFGEAISSATEGIKNGNSILVDNAGVTKNLSIMLKEAGFSANDLMLASTDAGVRQAIFNGILKETNSQAGNAAKLAESAAGKQAQWTAQTTILKQQIGEALQPALLALLRVVTPMIVALAGWVDKNPQLAAGILLVTTGVVGLIAVAATLAMAVAGLGPIFSLFGATAKASIFGVGAAFKGLSALVATPLVMPAIAVAAALASIAMVWDAYKKMMAAMDQNTSAMKQSSDATAQLQQAYYNAQKSGDKAKIAQTKKAYFAALDSDIDMYKNASNIRLFGLSLGTNAAPGGATVVGEHGPEILNIPQGAQVTPAWRSQSAAPQGGASVVIENFNSYSEADNNRFLRDIGFALGLAS